MSRKTTTTVPPIINVVLGLVYCTVFMVQRLGQRSTERKADTLSPPRNVETLP